jgi:hypothetical protein
MKLSIENNRVFVNDKEIRGWKRYVLLFLTYAIIPVLIFIILLMALTLVGVALSFIIPICIGVIFLAGIIFIISKILK